MINIAFISFDNIFSYGCHNLADGLNRLGVRVLSNIRYRNPQTSEFRFVKTEITPSDLPIFDIREKDVAPYPYRRFRMIDRFDIPSAIMFSMIDVNHQFYTNQPMLCTHENRYYQFRTPRLPWAFGLSDVIIRESGKRQGRRRENIILRNFRPSASQCVRNSLDMILLPHLRKYLGIDDSIIDDRNNHFDRLSSYMGCLAYGGSFWHNPTKHIMYQNPVLTEFHEQVSFLQEPFVVRWDSWRFWESLAMGCLTFHLDFDKYGFLLPVMPVNWKHYIGLNLEDIRADVERLMDERERIPQIAEAGREWAIENYSPVAVAKRFLSMIKIKT